MIQHIVRYARIDTVRETETWLNDMANEHDWELVAVMAGEVDRRGDLFFFRREMPES